ncbi:MAG TPA: DNA recombination protein RmuC [Granulicella sp.]
MLAPLLILAVLNLIAILFLLLRRPQPPVLDPRLTQLVETLPAQLARLEDQLRSANAETRAELRSELALNRQAADTASTALRTEITQSISTLGQTLTTGLAGFREDNAAAAEKLRIAVQQQMETLTQRLTVFASDTARNQVESREALHNRLNTLSESNTQQQEKLRAAVEERLEKLNTTNAAKLEEMRVTVDEKLQSTLQTRLTESFGQVTDQLTKVHAGLGEMNTLTAGVNDLNRIFSNVKSRGGFAEVQLGKLLDQVLAPGQYVQNANIKPGTQEVVEYAVRFPGMEGDVLLPIDAKFPREDWERLESAYESSDAAQIDAARKAFDAAIRTEGKRICTKYIHEPVTTPYAIMFLPTESLYSEVLRRDGLQADLHLNCRVMVAGPTNLYALLTSFQLGFRMLNLQKKGDEVWKVLGAAQTEFSRFGSLMDKMDKQVGTVQNTIRDLGVRTRAINRTLRDVADVDSSDARVLNLPGIAPLLAASSDGE